MITPVGRLDAETLERVRALHVRARQAVAGWRLGLHRSVRVGQAMEFADHRPYLPGDNLRDLDWRVLARADRLVVRRYRAETELGGTILLDASADLGSDPAKFDQAVGLCAALAWLLLGQGEPVGLVVGAGEGGRDLARRSGRAHLAEVFSVLAQVRPAGRADLGRLLARVGGRLPPRALALIVGDFMEEPDAWTPALSAMIRRRADVRAFHVYARAELGLAWERPLRLYSPEGGADAPLDPVPLRPLLAAEAGRFFGEVASAVRTARGVWLPVEARADLAGILARFAGGVPQADLPELGA
jgi:hypothetical protein